MDRVAPSRLEVTPLVILLYRELLKGIEAPALLVRSERLPCGQVPWYNEQVARSQFRAHSFTPGTKYILVLNRNFRFLYNLKMTKELLSSQ